MKKEKPKEGWLNAARVDHSHCQCHWLSANKRPVNKGTLKTGETVMCTCCVMAWDVR